jgi:predicted RNase H-like HicB family nuclease
VLPDLIVDEFAGRPDQPPVRLAAGSVQVAKSRAVRVKVSLTEVEQEGDGRWIAEVPELPDVMCYGKTREEAVRKAQALSLRVLAERLEHGEPLPQAKMIFSIVA